MAEVDDSLRIVSKKDLKELTASEVGAVPLNGVGGVHNMKIYTDLEQIGIASDTVTIDKIATTLPNNSYLAHTLWWSEYNQTIFPSGSGLLEVVKKNNNYVFFRFTSIGASTKQWFGEYYSETSTPWSGWKQVFLADGSVAMSGDLYLAGGHAKVASNVHQVLMYVDNAKDTTNRRLLTVVNSAASSLKESLKLQEKINGKDTEYFVHGTHNKPRGSYTGNGSATERVIKTGGIGNSVIIYCSNGSVVELGVYGGWAKLPSGTLTAITRSNAYYSSGEIHLTTTLECLNENGETFIYECK